MEVFDINKMLLQSHSIEILKTYVKIKYMRIYRSHEDNYFADRRAQLIIVQAMYRQLQPVVKKYIKLHDPYDMENMSQILTKIAIGNKVFADHLKVYQELGGDDNEFRYNGRKMNQG